MIAILYELFIYTVFA